MNRVGSNDDGEQEQETLYVLQNQELMKQIKSSLETNKNTKGYQPNSEEMNDLLGI